MPAVVAPEGFETHRGFIAGLTPELTGGGIGGHAPFAAALAGAARALDGDRTKARLEGAWVSGGKARAGLTAHRAARRGGAGFGLRATFEGLTKQFLDIAGGLRFEMPAVLIADQHEVLDGFFQRAGRARGECGQ